jgi:hypothetical protein
MRTVFRPFFKVIDILGTAANNTSGVELRDSGGNLVSCNFVSVATSGDDTTAGNVLVLEPSGMTSNVPVGPSAVESGGVLWMYGGASSLTGSGALGDACSPGGTAQLVLGIGDRVEVVNLTNFGPGAGTIRCIITYGNVNVQNPIKDVGFGRGS